MEGSGSLSQSSPSLTDEQRERIERNRELAKERLKLSQQKEVTPTKQPPPPHDDDLPPPPSKRPRKIKDSEFMMDLKDVCSQGSIVRVQGTKLIDTGGGFLIEEKDLIEQEEAEKVVKVQPAAFIPSDSPICEECGVEFSDSFLFEKFDFSVCDKCKDTEEKHALITRTDAKNEYLLKDVDFDKREPPLKFICRPNPHNSRWGDMKLYLRPQVEKRAIEVWGSLEKISDHAETREENRVKSKIKKYNKKMVSLRMSARSSLYTRDLTPHEHKWGPDECVDEDEDTYRHKCVECGVEETFEKM